MSLNLDFNCILNKLSSKKIIITKKKFINYINSLFALNNKLIKYFNQPNITGYESDHVIGIGSESSGITKGQGTNPLIWEVGHFCYFFEYHCFRHIEKNYKFYIEDGDIYDSFITSREYRFKFKKYTKDFMVNYVKYTYNKLLSIIKNFELNEINSYLLLLTILHNHMHCESFIFTKKLLGFESIFNININNTQEKIDFKFIDIKGDKFKQGTYEGENLISFDNEMPQFEVTVKDFKVSKYCVTEKIILKFIESRGYQNKDYWSKNGWRWVQENEIELPFYWFKKNNDYFIKDHKTIRKIKNNLPACHISYFEAEAIAKWLGCRLPTESEWEYISTNSGKTKYPWGNEFIEDNCNLNYSGNICNVNEYQNGDNSKGVSQLFGNVWEWCQEPLYPYDGFKIDPVYREFSYPFFGFKRILRGGSWACPSILINSRYRNAQMPDCRFQFTGFRLVKL